MQVEEVDVDLGALAEQGREETKEFLLTVYYPELVKRGGFCGRNRMTKAICKTDEFWQEKLARDFGVLKATAEAVRRGTTTWRREYHHVFRDYASAQLLVEPLPTAQDDLTARSKDSLKKVAREFYIKGYYKLNKSQLVKRLLKDVPERDLLMEVNKYPTMK